MRHHLAASRRPKRGLERRQDELLALVVRHLEEGRPEHLSEVLPELGNVHHQVLRELELLLQSVK